ncbi:MAG: hypothetical protein ACRENP_21260, partial [Longimicrobiales bacterium]
CKIGPEGTTATFAVTATPAGVGTLIASPFTLPATSDFTSCAVLWQRGLPGDPTVSLTVTEIASSPGTALDLIVAAAPLGFTIAGNSITMNVNFDNGGAVTFKNKPVEVPPPGQGCTPGYWGRSQHFDSWTAPYTTSTLFFTVFGVNAYPGKTLLQMINNTGGGPSIQLGRHAVASLLSAAHPDLNFPLSPAQVIADFNAAWSSGNYEAQKNIFDALNNAGCPLN